MKDKSVGRGFLLLSLAGILVKVLSAAYVPLLRNIIDVTGYGVYSASYMVFIFIFAITTMGAQPAIMKVVTELRALGNTKDALRAMRLARKYLSIIGLAATIIFAALAFPIARWVGMPSAGLSMLFLAPTIFLSTVLTAYRGYIQGIEDMKTLAISQVLEQLVNVVLSLAFAYALIGFGLNWGSAGGTVGTSIGALVAIIFILFMYYKNNYEENAIEADTSTKKVSDKKIKSKLLAYGLPITLVAAMQNAGGLIDVALVTNRLEHAGIVGDAAKEAFGQLSTFNTMIYVPLALVTALSMAIFPKIIQAFIEKNKKDLKSQMAYSFRLTYMITIPAAFGLAILSKEIYISIFDDITNGYKLLLYGSSVLVLMSITTIQNTVLQGVNKLYLVLKTAGIGLLIKFAMDYTLVAIDSINIMGAVIGSFLSFLVPAIINHKKLEKFFRVKIPIVRQAISPIIASMFMSGAILLCKSPIMRAVEIFDGGRIAVAFVLIVLIALGGVVYLYIMIYLGGIRKADLDLISPRLYSFMPRHLRKELL